MLSKNTGRGIPKIKLDYTDPNLLIEVFGYARNGYEDQQIAQLLGVAAETFGRNKRKKQADGTDSDLKQFLDKGRYPLNIMVENALYQLAVGLKLKTTVRTWYEYVKMPNGNSCCQQVTETTRELPPNLNAIMLWLRAYKPDIYNIRYKKAAIATINEAVCVNIPRINTIQHVIIPKKAAMSAQANL